MWANPVPPLVTTKLALLEVSVYSLMAFWMADTSSATIFVSAASQRSPPSCWKTSCKAGMHLSVDTSLLAVSETTMIAALSLEAIFARNVFRSMAEDKVVVMMSSDVRRRTSAGGSPSGGRSAPRSRRKRQYNNIRLRLLQPPRRDTTRNGDAQQEVEQAASAVCAG